MRNVTRARSQARPAFTMAEIVVAAFIAGTAMLFVLSLGQANVQMSQLNQEGLLARQVAMDVLDYFSRNLPEARWQAQSNPRIEGLYATHAAFRDALEASAETKSLFQQMEPEIVFEVDARPALGDTADKAFPGLHRLSCSIAWKEGSGRRVKRAVSFSRLVAETP